MKKSQKRNDLKKRAIEILKIKTGWDNVTIGLTEDRILANGENVLKFTGFHSKLNNLPPISIYLNSEGEEIKINNITPLPINNSVSDNQFLESLESEIDCEKKTILINKHLSRICASKFNSFDNCKDDKNCSCATNQGRPQKVDLIILIDTSGSMNSVGRNISIAAENALQNIVCPTDLRLTWLGIAGTFGNSNFEITSRCYLKRFGVCNSFVTPDPSGTFPDCNDLSLDFSNPSLYNAPAEDREEGARTIIDLCNCFDWRPDACRSIFYISDEPIHRGDAPPAVEVNAQTELAIDAAITNDVTVFTHYIENATSSGTIPFDEQNYLDISQNTGGQAFIDRSTSVQQYTNLLNEAICNACGGCKTIDWPQSKPCITVSWGDSDCDCIETNDFEVLCITICNCYENVTFENMKIGHIYVVDENGNQVPYLPDGTPSVEVLPIGPLCFGNIGPCQENQPTCISRQIILRTRGAIGGGYSLKFQNICFEISHSFIEESCFEFELCRD